MKSTSEFLHRALLLWIVIFALTLPFPLSFFGTPGEWMHPFFQRINHWSATHLFHIEKPYTSAIESDSTGFYLHLVHLTVLAVIGAWTWLLFKKPDVRRLKYWLQASATYILAFFLLKYGFDKVFKVQFYQPEPNTLFTPLGFLSRDILFWSTAGSSYGYSLFSGLMEVIPALLLFSRRTRMLGGIIAWGVMLHVLVINFTFDISVKILSIYLLLLATIVVFPYLRSLWGIFVSESNGFPRPEIETANRDKPRWMRFLKGLIIAGFLFESLYTYVEKGRFNDDNAARPKLHGAYTVVSEDPVTQIRTTPEKSKYFGDLSGVKRVFVHRKGYFIFQFQNDKMKDFQASVSDHSSNMTVKTNAGFAEIKSFCDPKTGLYLFSWDEGEKHLVLVTEQVELDQLPLRKNKFIWNVDSYE